MKTLTKGQVIVLSGAAVPMVVFGFLGSLGTYSNIMTIFDRSATALGVVAAGECATLVLALVMVGLTMLGQPSPKMVRLGLWALPMAASSVGAVVAPSNTEKIVFAITPMAMCVSAEGFGLLARRIVVYRTGVDMEAQRRNAETLQKIAYHNARSKGHPSKLTRTLSERKAWRLARKVGTGDASLGSNLVSVQRERMTQGADSALVSMLSLLTDKTAGQNSLSLDRTAGQDSRTGQPVQGQDSLSRDRTAGQDSLSLDKTPRTQSKLSVRAFLRTQLKDNPGLVKADAKGLAVTEFNAHMTEENFTKSWQRARTDLGLS